NAPGCYDNWADVKTGGGCVGQTQTTTTTMPAYAVTTYTSPTTIASCPVQTQVEWSVLTYDADVPSNSSGTSSLLLEVQVAPVVSGVTGTFTPWYTAANTASPTSDPAVCPFSGVAGCPKNLYNILGGMPTAGDQALTLQATLTPTPDGQAIPTIRSWQVAY